MSDKKWNYPPDTPGGQGQSVTVHEDGSVTVKDANGTETHYDPRTGNMTTTPPTPPAVTPPGVREVRPDGEIRVRYGDRRVRFYPGPPRRFKIVRDNPPPREEEFNLDNGKRGVIQQPGGQKVETEPSSSEELPTTHPAPAETPAPTTPPSGGGGKAPGQKKKPKKKVRRKTPAKPKKKAKRPAPRRRARQRRGARRR